MSMQLMQEVKRRVVLVGDVIFTWSEDSHLCSTLFPDGTVVNSWPQPEHQELAGQLGYSEDQAGVDKMNRQHELLHSALAWKDGKISAALWAVAHGLDTDTDEIRYEEAAVLQAQKLMNDAYQEGTLLDLPSPLFRVWNATR